MQVPNLLMGELYPSTRVARCPRFSRCEVCQKCQNYNRHLLDCNLCESRLRVYEDPASGRPKIRRHVCTHIADGEYIPDLQVALRTIRKHLLRPAISYNIDTETEFGKGPVAIYHQDDVVKAFTVLEKWAKFEDLPEAVALAYLRGGDTDEWPCRPDQLGQEK